MDVTKGLIIALMAVVFATPIHSQSASEHLNNKQLARFYSASILAAKKWCPAAESAFDVSECKRQMTNISIQIATCADVFILMEERFACYEHVRHTWEKQNSPQR